MKFSAKALRIAYLKRVISKSGLFDPEFYASIYPDVRQYRNGPLDHFVRHGGKESRSPSRDFDGPAYVMANPASRNSENILIDWLKEGKKGKRTPPRPLSSISAASSGSDNITSQELQPIPVLKEHYELVQKSGFFDARFYRSAYVDVMSAGADPLKHYLGIGWQENRNPGPLFDTHFVASALAAAGGSATSAESPLIRYLKKDGPNIAGSKPAGSIILQRRDSCANQKLRETRIGIHIHLHYSEMIQIFVPYLKNFPICFDLLVSTPSDADARFIANYLANEFGSDQKIVIRVTPNRGRDIAPFLIGFKDLLQSYDYVCHLHSKRSPHTHFGRAWLEWVLRCMFGEEWLGAAILDHMDENPDCMMMFPDNFHDIKRFTGWNGNEDRLRAVLKRFGIPQARLPEYANFAAGSMAWFRASFILELAQHLSIEDFEEESGQVEGTLAHVLERAIPLAADARHQGVCRYYLHEIAPPLAIQAYHGPSSEREPVVAEWARDTPRIARQKPLPLEPLSRVYDQDRLQISWVIPDFGVGAGGHMTVFRMIEFLEHFGHEQTIWIQNAFNYSTPAAAKSAITRNYRRIGSKVHVRFLPKDVRQMSGDAIIATDCWTAFPVSRATNFKERFYFIQDFEPYFHPMGENYLIAESTYSLGFSALCAGNWLHDKAQEYGMWARSWDLAVDRETYFSRNSARTKPAREPKSIVFYSRSNTPRRAVNLGIAAFEELAKRRNDFVISMFGERDTGRYFDFPSVQMGILSPAELGDLYREADLGVSFSTTNYSLVPLEMMACGLAVVEIDSESARTAFPAGTVSFAKPSPIAVADAIEALLDDADRREEQVKAAQSFIASLDWEQSARIVESAIRERLAGHGYEAIDVGSLCPSIHSRKRKASVVIPTYNGGELFHRVLEATATQDTDFDYDVLVIDSSSTDGTGEFAAKYGGRVRCVTIDQREFQHGRTRNLAIGLTDGDVVGVLTQDALPMDRHWLGELVAPFAIAGVAGAIGRHRAYPHHNRLVARDLDTMFDRFRDLGSLFSFDDGLPGFLVPGSIEWRMTLHFYSDNNSAMRRSVWEKLPYPEVDWGEDQIWCWEMLKLGMKKAYADKAVVWHSHDLGEAEHIKVAASEGQMFSRYFGYDLTNGVFGKAEFEAARSQALLYATEAGIPLHQAEAYARMTAWSHKGRSLGTALAQFED